LPDHGDGKEEDHDVAEERQAAIDGAAYGLIFTAPALNGLVVEESNRSAHGEVHDPGRDAPSDGIAHVYIRGYYESPVGEEAEIKEENGQLDAYE
jgi:hypothetical protein